MQRNHEYISPPADQSPKNSAEALRARMALIRLEYHFDIPSIGPKETTSRSAKRRLYTAVRTYLSLSEALAQPGISRINGEKIIKEDLKVKGLIDRSNHYRADIDYEIIAEGCELNREYWSKRLGLSDENT